jgi:hypothetical protein
MPISSPPLRKVSWKVGEQVFRRAWMVEIAPRRRMSLFIFK